MVHTAVRAREGYLISMQGLNADRCSVRNQSQYFASKNQKKIQKENKTMMAQFTASAYDKAMSCVPNGKIPWHTIRTEMRAMPEHTPTTVKYNGIIYTATRSGKTVTVSDVAVDAAINLAT